MSAAHRWLLAVVSLALGVVVVLVAGVDLAVASEAAPPTPVVDISNTPRLAETEEYICADPSNPQHLIMGSNVTEPLTPQGLPAPLPGVNGDGIVDIAVYSSQNGGRSWTASRLPEGGLGSDALPLPPIASVPSEFANAGNVVNADQSCAFDRHGNAYYASANFSTALPGDSRVRVWRSTDGGRSFGTPVIAASSVRDSLANKPFIATLDRPFLAVDNSGGPHDGTVYVGYEDFVEQTVLNPVQEVRSTDHGKTFSSPVRVDDPAQDTQADPREMPSVDGHGNLYVVYDVGGNQEGGPLTAPLTLMVSRSSDGGQSFSHFVVDRNVHRPTDPDEAEPGFVEFISAIAADPRRSGRVAVAWPEATSAGSSKIVLRYSTDGGKRFSPRIDVATGPGASGNQHDHVSVTYLPDGRLAVVWRDRRCCGGTFADPYEVYSRIMNTTAGGTLTAGPEIPVSIVPTAPSTSVRGVAPDEYLSSVGTSLGLGVTWNEFRGSLTDDVFRLIAVPAPASLPTRRRAGREPRHHRTRRRSTRPRHRARQRST